MLYACRLCGPNKNYRHIGHLFRHLEQKHSLSPPEHVDHRLHVALTPKGYVEIHLTISGWAITEPK